MNILDEEPIRIRDCACPGSPHADTGDLVRLRPKLTAAGGAAVLFAQTIEDPIRRRSSEAREILIAGIGWWNLTAEKGRPIPINEFTIADQIDWVGGGSDLFILLAGMYFPNAIEDTEEVEAIQGPTNGKVPHDDPLVTSESSSSGLTEASTSATQPSSTTRRRPSKSSSPANTEASTPTSS